MGHLATATVARAKYKNFHPLKILLALEIKIHLMNLALFQFNPKITLLKKWISDRD